MTVRVAHVATIDLTLRVLLKGQLLALRDAGYDVSAISAPGPWAGELASEGIRFVPWHGVTRAWDPSADLRAMGELIGILRRERFDVVHTHTVKPGVMGRVIARALRVPLVVNTVHGFYAAPDHALSRRAAYMGLEWLASRCSHLELFQSTADMARARALGIARPGRAILIGNGADLRRYDPGACSLERMNAIRASLGIEPGAVVVGTVGRLVAEKGYREFLDAAAIVSRLHPHVRFVAVGEDDPAKDDAFERRRLQAENPHVVFTGWREDMPELLSLFDVFVLASWREGFPRSAIEAAAMGKPLVLSDIPGCHEVAGSAEAVFVPVRDTGALAASIGSLVTDPDRRARMGRASRERAVEHFDEKVIADRVIGAYERHLGR